ncbi:MAG: discoidin domain-containing protein [Phycisphaerae bacterium]|nr:discoidin domain-containing protein [Phycisphaerae bacterium]
MMSYPMRSIIVGMLLFALSAVACAESSKDPFREIFPIPREGEYQQDVVPVGAALKVHATTAFKTQKLNMMIGDLSGYLTDRYNQPFQVKRVGDDDTSTAVHVYLLRPGDVSASLAKKIFDDRFTPEKFPEGPRRRQSFIIRSFLHDAPPAVYIVSESEQGSYYALFAVAQLIRWENSAYTLRGADVVDWPAFEARLLGDMSEGFANAPIPLQRDLLLREAAIQRLTHSTTGEASRCSQPVYALERWLRVGDGYWVRPTFHPPLTAFNWSAPVSIEAYASIAAEISSREGVGAYLWHDATDAGWWRVYLDHFWAKRDVEDRKNYPDDPTPARADAARFSAMLASIQKVRPDIDVFLTLPCYYDTPGNDKLPRVDLLRNYLRVVGASIPKSMRDRVFFFLEERTPEDVNAYKKYLGGIKLCQYRYTPLWNGGTWDTNCTELKRHDGITDAALAGGCNMAHDLVNLLTAQYLWNPDIPTDEAWMIKHLAPRAAYLAYGRAYAPVVKNAVLNFRDVESMIDVARLKQTREDAIRVRIELKRTLATLPESWRYSRACVGASLGNLDATVKIAEASLAKVTREISLEKATVSTNSKGTGDVRAAVLGKEVWRSENAPAPHWVEINLPQPYQLNQVAISMPKDNGYSWADGEVQAEQFGVWKSVAGIGIAKNSPQVIPLDNVRTRKIRLLVKNAYDWSKDSRDDMILSGVRLFGLALPDDPPGVERLDGRWRFRLDVKKVGLDEKWFAQTDFAQDWFDIIVPSYFEKSGIEGAAGFDGWAWYARTFEVPPTWKNRVVKLRFEAVDDEAVVWLNGRRVGEHRKKGPDDIHWYREPFLFDISECIRWDGPNSLVVLVNDFTLDGGIYKSVMIHLDDGPGLLAPPEGK